MKVAILTGAGDRAFVAGADVGEFAARTPEEQREVYRHRRVYDALAEFPKPVICAIHGFCIGGGNELALACDVRVADATARFGQFEIRLGLIPGAGGTQRLARLVGPGQALRIGLSGDPIDAQEAYRSVWSSSLVGEGRHLARARELALPDGPLEPRRAEPGQEGRAGGLRKSACGRPRPPRRSSSSRPSPRRMAAKGSEPSSRSGSRASGDGEVLASAAVAR